MEKRDNWQEADFISAARAGGWNFASFEAGTLQYTDESINDCFNCHNTTLRTEFVYSRNELQRFVFSDEVQYVYCDQTGRTPCTPDQESPRN